MTENLKNLNTQALMAALFVGDDPEIPADFVAQVREDEDSKDMYNQLVLLDDELGGDFESTFGESAFLSALDAQLASENEPLPDNVVPFPTRRTIMGAIAMAAGLMLATTFSFAPVDDQFQPRSAVTPTHDFEMPQVHTYCVERTAEGPIFKSADNADFDVLNCNLSDELKLAYTNSDARLTHAAFFGVSQANEVFWYTPSPVATSPVAIETTTEPKPVGETIRLQVNHKEGPLRVYGVFTTEAVPHAELERWMKSQTRPFESARLDSLKGQGVIVSATMDLNKDDQ